MLRLDLFNRLDQSLPSSFEILLAFEIWYLVKGIRFWSRALLPCVNSGLLIGRACSAFPDSALLVAGKCSFTGSKLRLSDASRLDLENAEQALFMNSMMILRKISATAALTSQFYPKVP